MELFTDNPISFEGEDKFGFAPFAEVLKDAILQTTPLPFCVGVFGPWGSGKTSFMNLLRGYMAAEAGVQTIWFNPWKYDKKEDLWNALIQTILNCIIEAFKKDEEIDKEVLQKAKDLVLATIWLAVKKNIATLTAGVIDASGLDKIIEAFRTEDEKRYQHINQFEDSFACVVDRYCSGGKLVIFIDDLDRCLPENAITVLESLKLFFTHANCIFVLGIDHYVVEAGQSHLKFRGGDTIRSKTP